MKKIGILSMQRIFNYGSFLQAYGLKSILEELDCEVEFVDYHVGDCLIPADSGNGLVRKIAKGFEALNYKAPLQEKLRFIKYKKDYAQKYFPLLGITDEKKYNSKVDMLVIGSDEVFNCVQNNPNVGFSPELFGVDNNAKRVITYAASFGNTTLEKLQAYNVKDKVQSWLNEMDAISVRDRNSVNIVTELTEKEPEYHIDPVLAYDFVSKCKEIPKAVQEEKYILLYGYSGRFNDEECKLIKAYARKKGCKVLCIGGIQNCCDKFVDCSPYEVISYFNNAEAIITDTFHGTILSIITHSQFATIVRKQGYGNAEKLTDLLKRLKLTSRILNDISEVESKIDEQIDYAPTDAVIAQERENTYNYLKAQLNSL